MKKLVVVFAVIFAVVLSSCNCNDGKKADKDGVKTEAVAKKGCEKKSCKGDKPCCAEKSEEEKAACKADCKKACCADKSDAEKMECAADCTKPCCAKKSDTEKTACAADCKKECCADKKTM